MWILKDTYFGWDKANTIGLKHVAAFATIEGHCAISGVILFLSPNTANMTIPWEKGAILKPNPH